VNRLLGNDGANLITGLGGNDWLIGFDGNDTLNGGTGYDRMEGDVGNDIYYVDSIYDLVSEAFGSPADIDTVRSSISYALRADFENLELLGKAAINGTGNGVDNAITGNDGANRLNGLAGADTLTGGGGNDLYYIDSLGDDVVETDASKAGGIDRIISAVDYTLGANEENLTLLAGSMAALAAGNELNNILIGNALANTLEGGLGIDRMTGGAGSDLYRVDDTADLVIETVAGVKGGFDVVESSATFALGANLEQLILIGSENNDGTGNGGANTITGNGGNNKLLGGAGNDTLLGGGGDDTLNGGAGVDSLVGGASDNVYVVDNKGDVISDDGGHDRVQSSITYVLADDLEDLELLGTGAINGTGNGAANAITGNAGANILSGDLSADTIQGGAGNDRVLGGEGADSLDGGLGNDIVTGGSGADIIDVSKGNDRLIYADSLDGGDVVTGFDGNAAGGQDQVNLDLLFDSLKVAGKDRAARVSIADNGDSVDVRVDTDGDTGNGFELLVVTLNTADAVTVGSDVVLGS
jgi:Ca2+-binding RTX toxin-like protein